MPAAVGQAMDVPDMLRVPQLLEFMLESFAAETILEPGAAMSGFNRPSRTGPLLENEASPPALLPGNVAATAIMFLAVAGSLMEGAPEWPLLPAAKKIRKSG